VQYEDSHEKKFQDTAKVALEVRSKSLFRAVFIDYLAVWIMALAVALIVVLRKMVKKHK